MIVSFAEFGRPPASYLMVQELPAQLPLSAARGLSPAFELWMYIYVSEKKKKHKIAIKKGVHEFRLFLILVESGRSLFPYVQELHTCTEVYKFKDLAQSGSPSLAYVYGVD